MMVSLTKFFKSERGDAALTAVMVTAAVGTLLAFSLASSAVYSYKMQRSVQLSAEQKDGIRQLDMILSNQAACTTALNDENLHPAFNDPAQVADNNWELRVKLNGSDTETVLDPSSNPLEEITPGLQLDYLGYRQLSIPPFISAVSYGIPGGDVLVFGKLIIGTKKSNSTLLAVNYQRQELDITVVATNGGRLRACMTDGEEGRLCKALGNFWNPFAPPAARCLPKGTCLYAGTWGAGPLNQGGFVNPITSGQNCPNGYDPFQRGNTSYGVSCGKNCVRTQYHPVYECAVCIGDNGARVSPNNLYGSSSVDFNMQNADALTGGQLNFNRGALMGLDMYVQ